MASNLTLAQKIQQKSQEQVQILEQAQDSAFQQLKKSMTENLKESELIIRTGIADLELSREELQTLLTQHLQDIRLLTDTTFEQYRTHLSTQLEKEKTEAKSLIDSHNMDIEEMKKTQIHQMNEQKKSIEEMIDTHSLQMMEAIESRERQLSQFFSDRAKNYLIGSGVILAIMMGLSVLFGVMIAKYAIEPQTLIYKFNPATGQADFYRGVK